MTPRPVPNRDAPPVPWLAVGAAAVAFFLVEHDLGASRRDEYYGVEQEALESAAAGQWGNRLGFTLLAAVGGAFLVRGNRPWHPRGMLPVLLAFLAGWCVVSAAWATDPARTARRLASLTFCLTGALGFARRLEGRELCWFVLALTAGFAALGVLAEGAQGTFRPFGGGRFAGTLHPNGQGTNCACLCLAAGTLMAAGERRRGLLVSLFVAGAVLLLATKSRTALAGMLLGLIGARVLRPSVSVVAAGFAGAWLLCCAALVAALAGVDPADWVSGRLTMGRMEEAGTLSGRTDLWAVLDGYARQRFWQGYGYGGFWTPARIDAVSGELYWGISSAHSAYYEAALGTGLVGLAALVAVLATGLRRAGQDYRATADPGAGLLFGILAYGTVQAFSESDLALPTHLTFLAACGLCRTALFFPEDAGRESR